MKRIGIFCIILLGLITIQTAQAMTVKDSLVQVLDTIPANKTRLNVLYLLAYQDPMSPSCLNYLDRLLKEAAVQEDIEYQCLAMYAYVVYYFNHQDGKNTKLWMDKLTEISLKHKYYNTYFSAKRAEILMHIIEHKIEYSITQAEEMYRLASQTNNTQGMRYAKLCLMNAYLMSARYKEGENAGFEAYRLLPATASLEERKDILQEISLACASIESEESLKYLKEFEDSSHQLSLIGNIIRQLLSAKWSYRRSPYSPQEDERIFLSNGLYPLPGTLLRCICPILPDYANV